MSRRPPRAIGIAVGVASALALVEVMWHPPARLIVYGVAVGSLYGLLAMGIVLVYRSHRIVNFAAGSMGAVPAVLALTLMTTHGLSWFLAFPLVLACGALAGATTHATVVRRFADAPRLLLTVVTIGVSQLFAYIAFQLPGWLGASTLPPSIRTPFSGVYLCRADSPLGPLSRACHRLLRADDLTLDLVFVLATVAAITVGLSWFFRLTRIGIALRASADNADRASLLGVPVHRVGTVAWAIAGALAATTIFLRAPLVGLPLGGLAGPAIILFALTAAAVARFENMGIALVAGIAMGVIDQSAVFASGRSAIATATMLPIVLVALALQRPRSGRSAEATSWQVTRIPTRIAAGLRGLPEVRGATVGIGVVLIAGALFAPYALGDSGTSSATLIVIAAIVGVSLVVLTGWAGQISLGQYGFVGIGSLVTGHLAGNLQTDAFVTLGAGALAGALVAVVIGWPAARLPGLLQAVTTLAFGAVVELYVLNPDFPIGRALLPQAANRILRPALWGRIDLAGDRAFYFACLVVLAGVLASTRSLRRHRTGRVLLAVRDNAAAASAYALPAGRTRLTAFAVSGCFAGLAGVLLAYQQGAVDAATYGASESVAVFAITVVGGIGSIGGAVGAAVAFEGVKLLERSIAAFQNLSLLATGPGLVLVLLLFPDGLAGGIARLRDRGLLTLAARHGLETPPDLTVEVAAAAPSLETAGDEVPVLAVRGLEAGYGRVQVLFGVDLEVHSGEIVALLGTNGAGKSTLLRAVSGLLRPTDGAVELDGEDVTGAEAVAMASRGVAQMPGGKAVFASLSVAEHFRVASWLASNDPSSEIEHAVDIFPVLRERWGQPAATLSGGEQQMLGLAMALVTRPRLLLIDELSLGLDPTTVARLIEVVRDVNERGTAVLLVDQSVDLAASIADRAYFLERGQVRFAGPPAELVGRADLVRSVFLQGQAGTKRRRRRRTQEHVLEVSGLRKSFGGITAVDGVDLTLPPDRIVGMIGPNGAGKTTVFDLISGYLTPDAGRILLDGVDITGWAAHHRAAAGLGRSFQDARIFSSLTVDDNVAVGRDRHVECRDHLASAVALPAAYASEAQVAREVDALVDEFGLERFRHVAATDLSTGTRHLVDLAMALAHRPSVLLLDEPSSGIAQAEAEMLAPMLRLVQERLGCAMLIIEHDVRLLSAVADEIVALDGGRVIARDTPGRLLRNRHVVRSYTGRSKAMAGRTR